MRLGRDDEVGRFCQVLICASVVALRWSKMQFQAQMWGESIVKGRDVVAIAVSTGWEPSGWSVMARDEGIQGAPSWCGFAVVESEVRQREGFVGQIDGVMLEPRGPLENRHVSGLAPTSKLPTLVRTCPGRASALVPAPKRSMP